MIVTFRWNAKKHNFFCILHKCGGITINVGVGEVTVLGPGVIICGGYCPGGNYLEVTIGCCLIVFHEFTFINCLINDSLWWQVMAACKNCLINDSLWWQVMAACKNCSPEQNIDNLCKDTAINRLPLSTALNGVPARQLKCRGKCQERVEEWAKTEGKSQYMSKSALGNVKKAKNFEAEDFHGPGLLVFLFYFFKIMSINVKTVTVINWINVKLLFFHNRF